MKILHTFPPNYAEINRAFNVRGKPIIFCFGGTIHNPARIKVPPELIVHEGVHSREQGDDPANWWRAYIEDPAFRLDQEIKAHCAEYWDLHRRGLGERLDHVAARLASPMYGNLIDVERARRILSDVIPRDTRPTGSGILDNTASNETRIAP